MIKSCHKAYVLQLSENDCREKVLRLADLSGELPRECLAPENAVPDVDGLIPAGMKPIRIRWGNGKVSEHFVYAKRFLLRKNKAPISEFFDDIGAEVGTQLVIQKIGSSEFAICELAAS